MESWTKKRIGALKDALSVGFANMSYVGFASTPPSINTRLADINIAVVKATRHNHIPPKEKYFLNLLSATENYELRRYIKHAVEERLSRTKNWMVAVKSLALIHRLIMDAVACVFAEAEQQMQHSSDTTPLVAVSQSFEDCSTPLALQFSLWIRKYSSYLAQRLHYKSTSNYVIVAENGNFEIDQLLEDLRSLHLLLGCLLDCTPPQEGLVAVNSLIYYALDLLVKECPKIYAAITDCIRKLLDHSFFDIPSDKALCFVYIYERILQQYEKLSDFYDACTRMGLTDGHGDYLSHKRFLREMDDRVKKYRHRHFIHLEEERIAKKETALMKETPQELERPMIIWWDSHDNVASLDGISLGSKNSTQQESYRSYHAVNDWGRALDMSIIDSSSTTNYESGNGLMDGFELPTDGMQIELGILNVHRTNPFLTAEVAWQQHQGAAIDSER